MALNELDLQDRPVIRRVKRTHHNDVELRGTPVPPSDLEVNQFINDVTNIARRITAGQERSK